MLCSLCQHGVTIGQHGAYRCRVCQEAVCRHLGHGFAPFCPDHVPGASNQPYPMAYRGKRVQVHQWLAGEAALVWIAPGHLEKVLKSELQFIKARNPHDG